MSSASGGSRFVVGIDLGTTNSTLAWVDMQAEEPQVEVFGVAQLVAPGTVESPTILPSFLLLPRAGEFDAAQTRLPWGGSAERIVGAAAARRAAESPHQVVSSAKSWLCHGTAARRDAILPLGAGEDDARISPLEATTAYLAHLRAAWDLAMAADDPSARLEAQDVILTVPASFDAEARELTIEAARAAGLPEPHLLEEPQAAVYNWVETLGDGWRDAVSLGDSLLVCDVGGGTTDFSLVVVGEEQGALVLERVAVGDHLLLGGDNMDLALAYTVRGRLVAAGKRLNARQVQSLVAACREAKERLLGADAPQSLPIVILGQSRKLIGGTLRAELSRAEVVQLLVEGFFPRVDADAVVQEADASGLSELGLPFVADSAISRHLASFLRAHPTPQGGLPTCVLYNGGVMAATALAERSSEILAAWSEAAGTAAPRVIGGDDLRHAVARGAVAYGRARRGEGIRIRGGTARSYYVGVVSAMPSVPGHPPPTKALCVMPFGIEEGSRLTVPGPGFGLLVGREAGFRLFASSTRLDDQVGAVLDEFDAEELDELTPLHALLPGESGERVRVSLEAEITEIGTLEVSFVAAGGERHRLSFGVRGEARGA
ncbi:MAG: Hsp70 family protein [Deltaproteobacteria bacterium]